MDHTKLTKEDRLDLFASVQFDPEVWELVQKKYNHFEDLHHELDGLQKQRRDLLSQLSTVNSSITKLQEQIVTLSGKEAEDTAAAEAESVIEDAQAEAKSSEPTLTMAQSDAEAETETEEPVVGLAPLEAEADDEEPETQPKSEAVVWPDVEHAALSADATESDTSEATPPVVADTLAAYEPAVLEPVAEEPAVTPSLSFAQPLKDAEADTAAPIIDTPAPTISAVEPVAAADLPTEVHDLQQLFDTADEQRRQSDSALKLVQLYDGKADVFFAAMCRSHQQSGLSENDARQEAIKDVQTMITTAKNHSTGDADAKKNQSGGVRRLFSH